MIASDLRPTVDNGVAKWCSERANSGWNLFGRSATERRERTRFRNGSIDRYTTLTSTNAEMNNTFTFHYEIDTSIGSYDYAELWTHVANGYCTAPNFDIFRKYDVPVNWDYYTLDGRFLRRFTTTKALCK